MSNESTSVFWERVEEHLQEDNICEEDVDTILSDPELAHEYESHRYTKGEPLEWMRESGNNGESPPRLEEI